MMGPALPPALVVLAAGLMVWAAGSAASRRSEQPGQWLVWSLGLYAAAQLLWLLFVSVDHLHFPLHIDLMEGTVWQHYQRAAAFRPIYPAPTPDYVPLAYNPLYYVLAVPFGWVLGDTLPTLRFVAVLGMLGSGLVLYVVARERTGSRWWGLMAVGLFAAAYRTMDTYLDNAHSDSWFLFAALLGTLILDRSRSRSGQLAGTALLVASFWFKQHGALFVLGGLVAITWRDGTRRTVPAWLLAVLLGPVAYVFAGPFLFGSHFHYFTWEVPSGWSEYRLGLFRRLAGFLVKQYAVVAAASSALLGWSAVAAWKRHQFPGVWEVQLLFALLSGVMGALDAGSADNVFIAAGTWLILMGTAGLQAMGTRPAGAWPRLWQALGVLASFALLAYDPRTVLTSPAARSSYEDLIGFLRRLDGPVYAPTQGQLSADYSFHPAAHWVALDDITRGPRRGPNAQRLAALLLVPAREPGGPAYVLANRPLDSIAPVLVDLSTMYVLEIDFGERFEPLRVLPKRFDHAWPRYLYRYDPARRVAQQ